MYCELVMMVIDKSSLTNLLTYLQVGTAGQVRPATIGCDAVITIA